MANIASGYLLIRSTVKDWIAEFSSSISQASIFSYGGDIDIEVKDNEIQVGFSCAWTGEECWDWIDMQLSENSSLSSICQESLVNSEISGYTYEYGIQHRDRIAKDPGEKKLQRQQAELPDEICFALKVCKAYDLEAGETLNVAGGTVTLLSKSKSKEDGYDDEFSFSISCGYSMEIIIDVSGDVNGEVVFNSGEFTLEDYDPDDGYEPEETAMYKEIIDGIVADVDEIYS